MGYFLPFYPLAAQKMKISHTWKHILEISSFYTGVPKIMIMCYTVPKILHMEDVIIFHFRQFFALNNPKNENFKKMKKNLEISSFNTCVPKIMIKNLYYSWDMACDGCNCYFFILGYFLPFYPPLTPPPPSYSLNNENLKKKAWRYHHFTQLYQKIMISPT